MLDESMSSYSEGALFLSISSACSPRHGSEEELDTNDSFWEFINKLKYPQIEEESEEDSEPVDKGEDKKINNEQEDVENKDKESAYDGDNDED